MALGARLQFRQSQGLVVTPQLQQAIKLLQLSSVELEAYLEAELERNPLLQREDSPAEAEGEDRYEAASEPDPAVADYESSREADREPELGEPALEAGPNADSDAARPSLEGHDWAKSRGAASEGLEELEGSLTRAKTLAEHLRDQAVLASFGQVEQAIAAVLIDGVDDGGYLRADLGEVASRLGCPSERVMAVLHRLQGFEPTGVFARDVPECLALQLKDRGRFDPAMERLLGRLDLLARGDRAALRRVCEVDEEDLREMIAELRALTPRPGAAFGSEPVAAVAPDVFVREGADGLWRVELNSDALPRVLVDQRYHAVVSGSARTEAERTYVSDCMASASWLIRSLDQRAKTILKVASEIVRQQDGFLAFGVDHLRPLNLKTVAAAIDMHESTVSRVTCNKYIATPRGLFEMKFFFTAAIASSEGGEAHSAASVRNRIRQMVEAEAASEEVLSDDRIVEMLKGTGVEIARRTVAKYRETLRIPSSVERRRLQNHTA